MSSLHLSLVQENEKDKLASLVDPYLLEHADFQEKKIGPLNVEEYIYFREYWREKGRFPYFIQQGESIVGFVMIRTIFDAKLTFYQVAEFHILPDYQGKGYGQEAMSLVWDKLPGEWELQVLYKNKKGRGFWKKCVENNCEGEPLVQILKEDHGRCLQYNFTIASLK